MRMSTIGRLASVVLALALPGCARPRPEQTIVAATSPSRVQAPQDPTAIYHQMGLIATGSPLSFVGKIAYFASSSPDTTMMLTSVSIPNKALSFVREGDSYRAPYEVHLLLTQGTTQVAAVNSMEIVRVPTFKEINRTDESVIFQHYFKVKPGNYNLSFQVRDATSARSTSQEGAVTVPALQSLPPRQRAALVLRDVLGFRTAEVAEMLDTGEASVKGALQRARAALEARLPAADRAPRPNSARERQLVGRFADAVQSGDLDDVIALADKQSEEAFREMMTGN